MGENPFDVFSIETIPKLKWDDSKKSTGALNNFITTPFGTLRPLVICDNIASDLNLKFSWEHFFFRFVSKVRDEMKYGLSEILSTISSFEKSIKGSELLVIGALSGINITDHSIAFGILEEFLRNSSGISTFSLEHDEIGIDGLNLSKIIDTIWNKIKEKHFHKINSTSSISKLVTKYNVGNYLNIDMLFESEPRNDIIPIKTSNTHRRRGDVLKIKRDNHENPNKNDKFDFGSYLKSIVFDEKCELFSEPSTEKLLDLSINSTFNLKQKDLNSPSKGLKLLGDTYSEAIKKGMKYKPIVLLIPGSECFSPGQISQLLEIIVLLKESYMIPFVVILGVSTNVICIQQIIGQMQMKKIKLTTPRLLDSRTVFFKSILNQLIIEVDNILPVFTSTERNLASNTLTGETLLKKDFIFEKMPLIPFISPASLRQIKDNFFQQDLCLSSAIRTIFLIFQDYFSNNNFGFLVQPLYEVNNDKLSNTFLYEENMPSKNFQLIKFNGKRKKSEKISKSELVDFRNSVLKMRLAIYVINTFLIELDFNDINERYNQLIDWLELIKRHEIYAIEEKIKLFDEKIRTLDKLEKRMKFIFEKINFIMKSFFSNSIYRKDRNFTSELFNWCRDTFRSNLSALLVHEVSRSSGTQVCKVNSTFKMFINSYNINESQDIYIDKLINPIYLLDTFKNLIKLNRESHVFVDYFTFYQILKYSKDQRINLYDLLICFLCDIYYDKFEYTNLKKINIQVLEGKLGFIGKLVGFSDLEKYLFGRYTDIIITFQIIGVIEIHKKTSQFFINNDFNKISREDKSQNCQNDSNKAYINVFKCIFSDIYAQKLHWDFTEISTENNTCDENDQFNSDIQNYERYDQECGASSLNKSKKNEYNLIKGNKKKCRSDISPKKSLRNRKTLEIKQRAAEINLEKINRFKGIVKRKAVNSVNVLKELRNLNLLKTKIK